ncbi:fatty acid desaturase, partial [Vibrio sp. 10N.286.51.A4]
MFSEEINKELSYLSNSNNYRGLLGLSKDYLEISSAILISLSMENLVIYILAILFIGTRQRALATILHDSAHRVLCKNKKLNDLLGKYFSGYLIFQSFSTYVRSHVINHHNFLGDKERDPDYEMYRNSGIFDANSKRELIVKHFFLPFFLSKSPLFLSYLLKYRLGKINDKESKRILLYWVLIISFSYYFSFIDIVIFYWIIPLLTTFPLIGWFIELSEHYPIIGNKNELYKTRNRFGGDIENYLTGIHNENYHLTHHLRADIPYWNVNKAHDVMMKNLEYKILNDSFGGIFSSSKK